MTSNAILQLTERAFLAPFKSAFEGVVSGVYLDTLVSDTSENKPAMPYIMARAKSAEAIIDPLCGIFKVTMGAIYRSHVKATTPEQRETVVIMLNNFAYTHPAETLSLMDGYHCYGFVPSMGQMVVDTETKSYAYEIDWTLYCMPRNNS